MYLTNTVRRPAPERNEIKGRKAAHFRCLLLLSSLASKNLSISSSHNTRRVSERVRASGQTLRLEFLGGKQLVRRWCKGWVLNLIANY